MRILSILIFTLIGCSKTTINPKNSIVKTTVTVVSDDLSHTHTKVLKMTIRTAD